MCSFSTEAFTGTLRPSVCRSPSPSPSPVYARPHVGQLVVRLLHEQTFEVVDSHRLETNEMGCSIICRFALRARARAHTHTHAPPSRTPSTRAHLHRHHTAHPPTSDLIAELLFFLPPLSAWKTTPRRTSLSAPRSLIRRSPNLPEAEFSSFPCR